MDKFSKAKRSEIMSHVRSRDSKMELKLRKELWTQGFRYRKNSRKYFGTPDIVLPKYKTVIFVDSCFWHGCKRHGTTSLTRKKFWADKIEANKRRDKVVTRYYQRNGWKIIRVWEHDLKKRDFKFSANQVK